MDYNWLQSIITRCVIDNLCTKTECSTCGTHPFRNEFINSLGQLGLSNPEGDISLMGAKRVMNDLSECTFCDISIPKSEEAVRWMIYFIWCRFGNDVSDAHLFPILEGSWAENVLEDMRSHYQMVQKRSAIHVARQGKKKRDWEKLGID